MYICWYGNFIIYKTKVTNWIWRKIPTDLLVFFAGYKLLDDVNSSNVLVGDSCETEYSGRLGRCEVDCPIVEEEAQVGIDPTICGYQDLVTPIVCCPRKIER